jgi:hypothetical protein
MISLEEVKNILNFIGYGRLDALLWFLGFEESLGKRYKAEHWSYEWELRMRAAWSPVMDMRAAHEMLRDPYWESREFSYVWVIMAKLARGILLKVSDWGDLDLANHYALNDLGRSAGETLLGEALPLPKRYRKHWSYKDLYPSREDYEQAVLPCRIDLWQRLIERHRPRYVICYGEVCYGNRNSLGQDWERIKTGIFTTTISRNTHAYLMPFFKPDKCGEEGVAVVIAHANQE